MRHFFSFGRGRNAVFAVFRFSAVSETLFLLFFTLRGRPKVDFLRFFAFGRARNAVFSVFYPSGTPESRFSPFFRFRSCPKRCFCCFLLIRALGKLFFTVFCSSETSESCFFISAAPAELRFYGLHCKGKKNIAYKKMMFSF